MESIRKWFYKPKRDDTSLLAQFFYADEALNLVASELDSFDGRKDPERCSALVNHLRQCQDKVLTICNRIMDDVIPDERANRDFRVKFPDDVMQENLAGQLWFGAECLAAGSSIMNREGESAAMRPLAKALTKALENVRNLLREQCLRGSAVSNMKPNEVFSERLQEALKIFDRLFAEFELSYVSAMVPVKTPREYELQQLVVVLFSETLQRALHMKLLTQDMVDDYDPALMFTIPRLAIVSGLLIFPEGPLCLDKTPGDMSEMFRPFRILLHKIRELLWTLNKKELYTLEKLLCSSEEPTDYCSSNNSRQIEPESVSKDVETPKLSDLPTSYPTVPDLDDFVTRFYIDYPSCKQFVTDFYSATEIDLNRWQECTGLVEEGAMASWENTEESEDETEWVGETSECETVVTEILNSEEVATNDAERYVSCSDSEGKTSIVVSGPESNSQCISDSSSHTDEGPVTVAFLSSDTVPKEYPTIGEPSQFSENIQQIPIVSTLPFPLSSLIASNFTLQNQESFILNSEDHSTVSNSFTDEQDSDLSVIADLSDLSYHSSETIQISSGNSGFLLANQVGRESMLASIDGSSLRNTDLDTGSRESLPDGDSHEALSVATATLSTLLLSAGTVSPGSSSPNQRNNGEDETSIQSPIDSGLGTVVSCSDAGSFSDRSPDGAPTSALENGEYKDDESTVVHSSSMANSNQETDQQQLETMPCTCTSSSRPPSTSITQGIDSPEDGEYTSPNNSYCNQSDIVARLLVNSHSLEFYEESNCNRECELSPNHSSSICDNKAPSNSGVVLSPSIITQHTSDSESLICDRTIDHNLNETASVNSNSINESTMQDKSDLISDSHSASNNSRLSSTLAFSNNIVDNISSINLNEVRTVEESGHYADPAVISQESNLSSEVFVSSSQGYSGKPVPSVVVRTEGEGGDGGGEEEWVGVATGEGQCTLCSSNTSADVQSKLDYSSNWDYLRVQASGSKQGSSPSREVRRSGGWRWRGKKRGYLASKRQLHSSSVKVVPVYPSRNLEPVASSYSSTCSSCQSSFTLSSDSCSTSSDTSSFNSECQDDEEIALAMQAAEIANRNEARAKFRSSEDLVHRLFVCIAGVADQLQTNFAGDLRNILKCVFLMSATGSSDSSTDSEPDLDTQDQDIPSPGENDSVRTVESAEEALGSGWESPPSPVEVESPPPWVPDDMAPRCMACEAVFTVVRRRHHCRNCGKVFCARCSSNSVPLPRYGHVKPVRVCNRCFLYQVTPFTLEEVAATRS